MPKNIVPSPTAAVSVDRLTLNAADARDAVGAHPNIVAGGGNGYAPSY